MIFFRSPELKGILDTLRDTRDILERIAVVLEREPSSEVKNIEWVHGEPTEE